MAGGRDTGRAFQAELRRLSAELPRLKATRADARLATLRRLALAEGLYPAAELAGHLATEIRRDRAGTPVGCWIEALHLAAACDAHDRAAAPLLLATIGARLSG